jgi:hypothetical protein
MLAPATEDEEKPTGVAVEAMKPWVAWPPAWAVLRVRRVESVRRRTGLVSCILGW